MPLLRSLCAFLVVLAFVLGTVMPAPHGTMAHDGHDMTVSSAMDPMPADCDRCDGDAALPMACAKVFCAGSAMILVHAAVGLPVISATRPGGNPDLDGSGLTRLPDPRPPRNILIG
ncbi:hypothetical protein [Microvirga roseola]|uniref:hypothetical protein n=1 Tax=Microvirga roseola TaxID=2883126 RepID=UPI001E642132|nr:hypothetical protein [Microvirga roseola]